MTFLNKTKYVANKHRHNESQSLIGNENKHLLDKIVKAKNRKSPEKKNSYSLAMYEKRYR